MWKDNKIFMDSPANSEKASHGVGEAVGLWQIPFKQSVRKSTFEKRKLRVVVTVCVCVWERGVGCDRGGERKGGTESASQCPG